MNSKTEKETVGIPTTSFQSKLYSKKRIKGEKPKEKPKKKNSSNTYNQQ